LLANSKTEKTYGSLNRTIVEGNDYGRLALDIWREESARSQAA
jgi:hypothetical protein